jgi:hypothetical protein
LKDGFAAYNYGNPKSYVLGTTLLLIVAKAEMKAKMDL